MLKKSPINLSQSHLNLLSTCPPKFQRVYLDGLGLIPKPEQQEKMQWGSRFHLLMQQRELALPIESLLASDSELESSFKALIESAPELVEPETYWWREAEHKRTLSYSNFLLTAIYDLLMANNDRAIILDWKTYRQPQKVQQLARNWQTRLYLYLLAETSEYAPEQIQMVYWFVRGETPKKITFNYNQKKHHQTEQDLGWLISQLETWLENLQHHQDDFPHQPNCEQNCLYRQSLLAESMEKEIYQEQIELIEEIEEVPI